MTEYYSNVAQDELSKLENYKLIYESTHPFPEKSDVYFWKELGIEAGALIASAVGSIILSAIRTSTIFMLTEALLIAAFDKEEIIPKSITAVFPLISMIVSLVAFEGLLSAHGFIRGKESRSIEVSKIALWLCFGVTISAGLSASFGLLGLGTDNGIFQLVSWVLAVLTAIGAPVVAYYGSLNLGVILNKWSQLKYEVNESFEDAVQSWNKAFQSSFSGKRSQRLFTDVQNEQDLYSKGSENVQYRDEHLNKSEQCYNFVGEFVQSNERLPTMTEVEAGGFSRGLASNIVNKFIANNSEWLSSLKSIDKERVSSALEKYGE